MQEKLERAWQLFDKGDFNASEAIYLECLEQTSVTDYDSYASVLMGLIYTESFMEKFDEARNYARSLLEIAPNEEEKHIALHQAGMVERMAGDYERALKLFAEEALIIQEAFPAEDMLVAANLYEQAYVNLKKKDFEQAEKIMTLSLMHAKKAEDDMCIGCAYRGLGEIAKATNKIDCAKEYFEKSIEAFEKAEDFIAVEEVKVLF